MEDDDGGGGIQGTLEVMLDGKRQRVDIPTQARTAHRGLLQKRLEVDDY